MEIQGHRGARGLWPENTIAGFARTLELGVDVLELDVALTADGVPVLHHDQALNPGTVRDRGPCRPGDPLYPYAGRPIRELTLAQVKTLDAGILNTRFEATQTPIPGAEVPTLAELCELVAPHDVRLSVEIKTDPSWPDIETITVAAVKVLESYGLLERVRLLAFDWRVLGVARELLPGGQRVALVEPDTLDASWMAGRDPAGGLIAAAADAGATMLSPKRVMVVPELVAAAHARNLRVVPWTVNDPAEMRRLIAFGVDAIVTDYPDRLRTVLGR
ncbi:glycerophosphodiester phosphodiesterase [Actinoallomurus spadix]|uniref:Glycerophosphodiester phosphodiesterase family protein n=1 Tax=Actinoallomurus spadix TaxID=79912 RepID=A0ABN0X991_9ACTN|nr:glycerophosphodiester phosphodiesterase family protein [Actinoallomurus spadix]MCO5987955.1 glycerophosphodiester phosphodiesterase [Actinoallomurus spadix]